jgi:CBS domain-containing protein
MARLSRSTSILARDGSVSVICAPNAELEPTEPGSPMRDPVVRWMSRHVTCVEADVSATVVANLLIEQHISAVPVVDETGEPLGLVSKTDLVRGGIGAGTVSKLRARDLMTLAPRLLPESAALWEAAAIMAANGIHRVLVIDEDHVVVGVVSSLDVVRACAAGGGWPQIMEH